MLKISRTAQTAASGLRAIVIDGFYPSPFNSVPDLMESFYGFGYALAHHGGEISVFALAETTGAKMPCLCPA